MNKKSLLASVFVLSVPVVGFSGSIGMYGSSFTAPAVDGAGNIIDPLKGDIVFDAAAGVSAFRGYDGTTWQSFSAPTTVAARVVLNGGAQSIPDNTETSIHFNSETFDVGNSFNTSTYRFLPSVSGTYSVCSTVYLNASSNWSQHERAILTLKKNGSLYAHLARHEIQTAPLGSYQIVLSGCSLVQLNGSTDYIETYVTQDSDFSVDADGGGTTSHFSAYRVGGL